MSVQVVETHVVWVGKTDRIASFRKVEGYEDMFYRDISGTTVSPDPALPESNSDW